MKGLSIIPEGRVTKDCKESGALFEVSKIQYLDKYLKYSTEKGLGVLYLSYHKGIVYQDDIVKSSPKPVYKYSLPERKVWVSVVVEQIARECIMYATREVYLMIDKMGCYRLLVDELKRRGVEVYLPFLGI